MMRKQRREFVTRLEPATRLALEEQLAERLAPLLAGASILGAYAPIGFEISPLRALERAKRLGRDIAFPAFDEGSDTFIYRLGNPDQRGPFNIPQPSTDCTEVKPDMLLIPLLAIDAHGYRLGQGKGHFDRVLPDLPEAQRVAIGWHMQRIDGDIPRDDWDVPMHRFISPRSEEEFEAQS
ncbi:5-formyltetrahydrofolate cyclo-ligase [Sphingomicrobium sp. GRR-S6-50]|uniref:5-formyltetrahydrofolate cyclo-ligase n=2 Tax=Sphingomicrobium sediminis TaxID=2950949 RepID=A0A9X2J4B6_9SPHN|nr:5-formyltetrahydrofolate cyclo-ligase [Sphingomicrobium sediminis]